jgi:hypothetical protein
MDFLIALLFFLFIGLVVVTVAGHLMWVAVREVIRSFFPSTAKAETSRRYSFDPPDRQLRDLEVTENQIVRFYSEGKLNDEIYEHLMGQIRAERASLVTPKAVPAAPAPQFARIVQIETPAAPPREAPTSVVTVPIEETAPPPVESFTSIVTAATSASEDEVVSEPVPSFVYEDDGEPEPEFAQHEHVTPPPPPGRPFSEVLNSFMEESNIRWGEIIGGLLIIGCSTALVVSLWAQISQIPVLKFLIFTTVTAILFGIGLYTEHRWKLPTTSRGILTIATLLVPLNFLAIAAVSASNTSGTLVIGSELLAPAIFLCLVYFAGRIITPGCAHVLAAGVLGSSIGQLLVRHLATTDYSPLLLIFLGAFPVLIYVVTVGLALRVVLHDRQIDASETTTVFTIIGAMSFAALLPFGLLLYKSGPMSLSMMYLAPIVTLWGVPMVATGTVLWRRIANRELVASRTTGTALGILGVMIVLAGMILAWPNPSSIVPAALLNFAIFTVLAIALRVPAGHLPATICFALAYLVTFHVFANNIRWVNLRVMSLLNLSLSVSSGQALVGAFALLLLASEWLTRKDRARDSFYYVVSACLVGIVSLMLATFFGLISLEYHALWIVYGLYSLGAFWIAWRHRLVPFVWAGSALLLFSLAHGLGPSIGFAFPWQTALFAHATICAIAAIICSRYRRAELFSQPLNYSALISIVLGVVSLFQANTWEVTWMQAQRVFWIAGILLLLLWLNRRRLIFNAFQIALLCALVLTAKAALQHFDWYSYLPHAFLHPSALQIQGTILALFCLLWVTFRFLVKRALPNHSDTQETWLAAAQRLLNARYSIDRFIAWGLLGAFLLLAIYGSLSGVTQELAALGSGYKGFNIADFPHQEALKLGSWIVLGLLLLLMLANFWERRSGKYLLGALAVLTATIPLLAGQFESQIATATSWRFLAALFFLGASLAFWSRRAISRRLRVLGWPAFQGDTNAFKKQAIGLLIALTVLPLLLLTIYPALRAIYYLPVQGPVSGLFSWLRDDVSYGLPLVLVAMVMIGYALRERMSEFAFYAGVLFHATVTLAFLLTVASANGLMDRIVLVRLAQLNAITGAVYLLVWLSTRRRWLMALNQSEQQLADYLVKLQLGMVVTLNVMLFAPVIISLIWAPESIGIGTIAAGSGLGWLAFSVSVVAVVWFGAGRTTRVVPDALAGLLLGLSCLIAFSLSGVGGWVALHWLTVCTVAVAWLMLAASEPGSGQSIFNFEKKWSEHARRCAVIVGGIAVCLSLRTLGDAGATHWWSIIPLLAIVVLAATLNWKTYQQRYLFAAGILFHVAISVWWVFVSNYHSPLTSVLLVNIIAGSLAGIVWLLLELRSRKLIPVERLKPSFHDFVAILALVLLALFVIVGSLADDWWSPLLRTPELALIASLSLLALLTATLWDRRARYAVVGLYCLGLIVAGILLRQPQVQPVDYFWWAAMFLAAYTLVVALLWRQRERLLALATQLGIPRRIGTEVTNLTWLSVATVLALVVINTIAYWTSLAVPDFDRRALLAIAVALQFLTFGALAEGSGARHWRRGALAVLFSGTVLFGWSWLTPGVDATWLNRSVILMVEAFGLVAIYGLVLDKVKARWPDWIDATKACVPWFIGAGVIALFFCLGTEVSHQLAFGAVNIHPLSILTIGLTLFAAIVVCVLFALSPAHDPLTLSEQQRTRYVYAAEVLLVLLFLHIRLTMPWLFTGFLERHWPLVVMVVAYLGVIASESLRRRKLFVLAHPLERTGAFLPLLPVLGFWIASSEVDFSLLLFVIGGLYGLLSVLRRSFVFGVLAAVAGNAGLWYAFNRTADYGFLQHPQLWLIPVAVSVLIAAYLNEDKITEDQMTGVRYLSLVTIYVSSTADIFINGAANSPWLPLILGALSLAGIFAGIVFRIRGLLFLGAIFLLLSIITMIWFASVNFGWTWLWYVAGIVTGATIIFMFAVFEKKRTEVLRVVEGLKEWDL